MKGLLLLKEHDRVKDHLIEKLLECGSTKMKDGRQLYELTLKELNEEYGKVKISKGGSEPFGTTSE